MLNRCVLTFVLTAVMIAALVNLGEGTPFGINAHTPGSTMLDEVEEMGLDWIRIDFIWLLVEPEQDVFDWSLYDRIINDAHARGLKVFATIAGTPAWATAGEQAAGVPRNSEDWWDICYRAAARYRGLVAAWGMWNEPNLGRFWSGSRWDYQNIILLPGARAVHAADAEVLVAGPDLAHLSSADWDIWLQSCLSVAGADLDVATHHVYPSGTSAADVTYKLQVGGQYPWDPPSVKEVVQDAGWWGRPFWLTETGAESNEASEVGQAGFYYDLLVDWYPGNGHKTWVDRMFFYELIDDANHPEDTFGVIGSPPERQRKQAFWAYENFVRDAVVSDAAITGFFAGLPLAPGRETVVVAEVRNDGTAPWVAGDGRRLTVEGLPQTWLVEGGGIVGGTQVAPGETVSVSLALTPPFADYESLNQWWDVRLRMAFSDGTGFGSPRRESLASGWHPLPQLTVGPISSVVARGDTAVFSVVVKSQSSVSYEWLFNGLVIEDGARFSGVHTPRLTVRGADRHAAGEYTCVVSSRAGAIRSDPAALVLDGSEGTGPRNADGHASDGPLISPRFDDVFPARDGGRRAETGVIPSFRSRLY